MSLNKKSFCIVCIANYCRSPVVENFLRNRFGEKYEFISAGISPISLPNMDPRSLEFLRENNINHKFHTPKKINNRMLSYFDKFLAVDPYVLNQLNTIHPKFKKKFFSLTMQFNNISIVDPYHLQVDEYKKTMENIKYVVEGINLDEI
jgi:protein-tyrosine-phosphatase